MDALARDPEKPKKLSLSLSGTWKFNVAKSPFDAPEHFHHPQYDAADWGEIRVPGMWQMQGYGKGPQDVNLLAFPRVHIQDFQIQTIIDAQYQDAVLSVRLELSASSLIDLKLLDAGDTVANVSRPSPPKTNPKQWTAETPYLYQLLLSTPDCAVQQRVGFRSAELKNGIFLVNGKPVKLRSVNRHEHHPEHGRSVPYEFLKEDLLTMKSHNINAIRTSHQPNDIRLYDLADELGLWVMDEYDLECHGLGEIDQNSVAVDKRHLIDQEKIDLRSRNPARKSEKALKARFGDLQEASFQASRYRTADVDQAKHPYELEKSRTEKTLVRLDWAHQGLGTGSCGPATLEEYKLAVGDFEYEVLLE
ncbi:hypothetical protein QTJ16_003023 [Diplocarpon rosae]|uniref:beta-galactosidase n=1 Tax=Diplocarpon rosae TaxID=946125 RepID=A0AAD9T0U6_9HELO|nr:hypothetical protein QTJ16_003023 [Diplocarpon rosae]